MDLTFIAISIVFFLLDKGHEAENLQKCVCIYCITASPMEDSSESFDYEMISCSLNSYPLDWLT